MKVRNFLKRASIFFVLIGNVAFSQDGLETGYYLGLGASSISGNSQETHYDAIDTGMITLGFQVHSLFALELSSITNRAEASNGKKIQHFGSIAVLANYPIGKQFAILAKLGVNTLKIPNQSGVLRANENTGYGLGARYRHNNKFFVDALFEKIVDREINNRQQDFEQKSVVIKQAF